MSKGTLPDAPPLPVPVEELPPSQLPTPIRYELVAVRDAVVDLQRLDPEARERALAYVAGLHGYRLVKDGRSYDR